MIMKTYDDWKKKDGIDFKIYMKQLPNMNPKELMNPHITYKVFLVDFNNIKGARTVKPHFTTPNTTESVL